MGHLKGAIPECMEMTLCAALLICVHVWNAVMELLCQCLCLATTAQLSLCSRSTEVETETIENPHASEGEGRNASSVKEGMQTNGPQEEGDVEEEEYATISWVCTDSRRQHISCSLAIALLPFSFSHSQYVIVNLHQSQGSAEGEDKTMWVPCNISS